MADLLDGHRTGAELAVQPHAPQPGEAARDMSRYRLRAATHANITCLRAHGRRSAPEAIFFTHVAVPRLPTQPHTHNTHTHTHTYAHMHAHTISPVRFLFSHSGMHLFRSQCLARAQ